MFFFLILASYSSLSQGQDEGSEVTGGSVVTVTRTPSKTIISSVSGHSKTRPGSATIKSQGSLSIDSLSGSSSFSQKIAFSETNMQSSLGYLP